MSPPVRPRSASLLKIISDRVHFDGDTMLQVCIIIGPAKACPKQRPQCLLTYLLTKAASAVLTYPASTRDVPSG